MMAHEEPNAECNRSVSVRGAPRYPEPPLRADKNSPNHLKIESDEGSLVFLAVSLTDFASNATCLPSSKNLPPQFEQSTRIAPFNVPAVAFRIDSFKVCPLGRARPA
jgi:hypothetical protein